MSITHRARNLAVLLGAAALAIGTFARTTPAQAREFDISGTVDCGAVSERRCSFSDWSTGPTIPIITEDFGGGKTRVLVDAAWVRDDLGNIEQDDFVRFTVRDDVGPRLKVTGIVERHCDGTFNPGLSTATRCLPDPNDRNRDDENKNSNGNGNDNGNN